MSLPHARIIIAFCIAAIVGYAICSGWVVFYSADAALRGDVIGTWKSFAVAAFAFWLGSSSGGKAKVSDTAPPADAVAAAQLTADAAQTKADQISADPDHA